MEHHWLHPSSSSLVYLKIWLDCGNPGILHASPLGPAADRFPHHSRPGLSKAMPAPTGLAGLRRGVCLRVDALQRTAHLLIISHHVSYSWCLYDCPSAYPTNVDSNAHGTVHVWIWKQAAECGHAHLVYILLRSNKKTWMISWNFLGLTLQLRGCSRQIVSTERMGKWTLERDS